VYSVLESASYGNVLQWNNCAIDIVAALAA